MDNSDMLKSHETELVLIFIKQLINAITYLRLYYIDHPQAVKKIDTALESLLKLLKTNHDIILVVMDERVIVNNRPLKEKDHTLVRFKQILKDNFIETITFSSGITRKELAGFLSNITTKESKSVHSTQSITLGKIVLRSNDTSPENNILYISPAPDNVSTLSSLEQIKELFLDLKKGNSNSRINHLKQAITYFIKGFSHSITPMQYLGSIKSFDEYTFIHVSNVFVLTMCQAESLGLKGRQLYDIGMASVLHDTGKLFIPDEILNKPGKLTKKERMVMQNHTVMGARHLLGVSDIPELAIISAMDHHIRFNGTGYPNIKNCTPNIASQMIAISDAFDAMRSKRPYQNAKSMESIITILKKGSGTAFNPVLVNHFLGLLKRAAPKNDLGKKI